MTAVRLSFHWPGTIKYDAKDAAYSVDDNILSLNTPRSAVRAGTLAEELQHLSDARNGLFHDGRYKEGLKRIKAKYGKSYNIKWHADTFDRIADAIEKRDPVMLLFLDNDNTQGFRDAAEDLRGVLRKANFDG